MNFYYNPSSDRGWYEQLQKSHDQSNLIRNIDDIFRTQRADHDATLRDLSEQDSEVMRASTRAICGTISDGFSYIREGLGEIADGVADVSRGIANLHESLYDLTNLLDCHLRVITEELRHNNLLTANIALLLREPDSEKVRRKNIEKGLKFLNDAWRSPFFFDDARLFLTKAVEDEQTGDHTDYFVLHKLGLIYLYSHAHLNFDKAVAYFNKAATYSSVDTDPNASRLARILFYDPRRSFKGQESTIDDIRYLTGQSLMQISIAYYIQGRFAESLDHADRALSYAPSLLEAGFWMAKALVASGQNQKAADVLKSIIQRDPQYAVKTVNHRDLATQPEIAQMCEVLRLEEEQNATKLLEESLQLKRKMIDGWGIMESDYADRFGQLCDNISLANNDMSRKDYLSYLRAKKNFRTFINGL